MAFRGNHDRLSLIWKYSLTDDIRRTEAHSGAVEKTMNNHLLKDKLTKRFEIHSNCTPQQNWCKLLKVMLMQESDILNEGNQRGLVKSECDVQSLTPALH